MPGPKVVKIAPDGKRYRFLSEQNGIVKANPLGSHVVFVTSKESWESYDA